MRTNQKTVTFTRPFTLSALEGPQPAGTYLVVTEEERLEEVSFDAFRRTTTMLHVPADPAPGQTTQVVAINAGELEAALVADVGCPADHGDERRDQGRHLRSGPLGAARVSIGVKLRYGVWQVMHNRQFHGDYFTHRDAVDAARHLASVARDNGLSVDVELDGQSPRDPPEAP